MEASPAPSTPEPASGARPLLIPSWVRGLILVLLFTIPTLSLTNRVADPDVWWHMRTGQWVIEHGAVPSQDPFSSYGQTRPWVAYSWLFGVLLYGSYAALGLRGIVLVTAVLAYLVSLLLYRLVARRVRSFWPAVVLTALALLSLTVLFSPRPWLFSMLFSLLTLEAVLSVQEGRDGWRVWLLPAAYVLWANVHIQFIYGLLLLGLSWAAPLLTVRGGKGTGCPPRPFSAAWYRLVRLFLLCLAATLVNPYPVRLYGVIREYATQRVAHHVVLELMAPQFRHAYEWLMLLLLGLAAAAVGAGRRWDPFAVLLLAGAAVFAFRAYRDLWVAVFAAVAVLCQAWRERRDRLPDDPFRWGLAGGLTVSAAVAAVSLFLLYSEGAADEHLLRSYVAARFPTGVPGVIKARRLRGPLYNDMNYGGYLIWALHEEGLDMPVAVDLRTNLHAERLRRFADTGYGQPGWDRDPDLNDAGIVILPADVALAELLRRDPRFEEVPLAFSPARLFVARKDRPAPAGAGAPPAVG